MNRRVLWFLILVATVSLIILVGGQNPDPIANLLEHDPVSLLTKLGFLVLIGGSVLVLFREQFVRAVEAMLFWVAFGLLLVLAYTYREELKLAGDRILATLVPGHPATHGQTVEIVRGQTGAFPVTTRVNGARIAMTLDTGASSVVLTHEAARAAGLPLEVLNYTVTVETANGRTRAAPVTLDRVAIGGLTESSVPALVAQPGQLKSNLLGLTFLNRLESWEVRGDKLVLRGHTDTAARTYSPENAAKP